MVVMLARNNIELSKACLKTLLQLHGLPDILVIDNASSDGTAQWLRAERQANNKRVRSISCKEVESVSALWNKALDWAWKHGATEALVVNNDTELLPETWVVLRGAARFLNAGMVTCGSVRTREELVRPRPLPEPTPHPDFSCYLIQSWAHGTVRFDENYKRAYSEDCSMHVELHRAGIKALNIGLPFLHHSSSTIKTADKVEQEEIKRQADLNREYFFSRYGERIGTDGYSRLFSDATFGMNKHVAFMAPPLKV